MQLILTSVLLCGFAASAAVDTSTNWVALSELQKKWDPLPLSEVQKAAENGDVHAMHYLGYCYGEGLRVTRDPNQSLAWYKRGMQAGYLSSANNIGMLFHRGLFGSNGMAQAVYYYTYAAERQNDQSQMNLGVLYRDGNGVPQDFGQAMHWFQLAAAQGHAGAMVEIGRLYRFGQGVESNLSEAMRWFQKAVDEKNSPLGQANLALVYESQGQSQRAIALYEEAANQGSVDAMIQLYTIYWEGQEVPTNRVKAIEWITKAGNTGNAYAEFMVGYHYETRRWEYHGAQLVYTSPHWPEAFHWYRLSAKQNWPAGQYHLGMLYLRGKGVEIDEARGLELVRAAVDQGLPDAMHDLAQCYAFGIGEPRNDADRPIELLRRSKSWDELISRYEAGLGTERDLTAAAECYCEGALESWRFTLADKIDFHPGTPTHTMTEIQSFDERQIQVQIPYVDGSDDLRHALSLYLKSAKGDGPAAWQIGNRYLKGQDAPQSNARAWAWFTIAAQNGSAESRANLKELESHLTPEELKAGEQERARQVKQLSRFAAASAN
jgi:uncharacterized protein